MGFLERKKARETQRREDKMFVVARPAEQADASESDPDEM
jgi:hypothetical protein